MQSHYATNLVHIFIHTKPLTLFPLGMIHETYALQEIILIILSFVRFERVKQLFLWKISLILQTEELALLSEFLF